MTLIEQTTLLKILRYEPETGKLFWLPRSPDMFKDGKWTREHSCAIWNSQYAGKEAFTADNGRGYKQGSIFDRLYLAHRVIFCMIHGYWPDQVDHIDQDRGNNRIENFRDVDNAANGKNKRMRSDNTSGRVGVHWHKSKGKWHASIKHSGKQIHLGLFADLNEAVSARVGAEKKYGFHENHGRAS